MLKAQETKIPHGRMYQKFCTKTHLIILVPKTLKNYIFYDNSFGNCRQRIISPLV